MAFIITNITTPPSGGVNFEIKNISTDYAALLTDDVLLCSNSITITLPTVTEANGNLFYVKNIGNGNITVVPSGNETIDGVSELILTTKYNSYTLVSDGSNWFVI